MLGWLSRITGLMRADTFDAALEVIAGQRDQARDLAVSLEGRIAEANDRVEILAGELKAARFASLGHQEVVALLKERLEKRDDEYDKLHARYLALVDRAAVAVVERAASRREIVPAKAPPTLEAVRSKAVREENLVPGELPRQRTTEEIEALFAGDTGR